jgi:hypothetical protein
MATKKATNDSKGNALYLRVVETRDNGYFHLRAQVCTQRYEASEHSEWKPYGVEDDYSDGLKYTHLRSSCQGDNGTQRAADSFKAVYGFDTEYHDAYRLDLRQLRRMTKTLELVERKLAKLQEARGYVRSYGEYLGRVAEVLGCVGMVFDRDSQVALRTGQRYQWMSVGDGVNHANHRIYLWQQEAVERDGRPQLAGEEAAS